MVTVTDNGEGIDKADQNKLFQVFGVIKDVDRGINIKGIGLGLAICKLIVNKFGGQINFFSEKGQGATFYFTFKVDKIQFDDTKNYESV